MEEKAIDLLEKLAAKVGVAVDVLFTALMKQAMISAVVDVIIYILLIWWGFVLAKGTMKVHAKIQNDDWDDGVYILVGLLWIVTGVLIIGALCSLSMTLAGFFNQEYWVLEKLTSMLFKK